MLGLYWIPLSGIMIIENNKKTELKLSQQTIWNMSNIENSFF